MITAMNVSIFWRFLAPPSAKCRNLLISEFIWAIYYKSWSWMFWPFWVSFPYFSLPFGAPSPTCARQPLPHLIPRGYPGDRGELREMTPVRLYYCWWLKSGDHQLRLAAYPTIYRISYIPGGARFQPSTVWLSHDGSMVRNIYLTWISLILFGKCRLHIPVPWILMTMCNSSVIPSNLHRLIFMMEG